mgnify:CR=1 FL=1
MKDDRETKEKLLASAEHEFMEKGYQGASSVISVRMQV